MTFTATVSPGGTAGSPTGSITFTIDGVAQAPVALQVVNGLDQATLSIASLTQGQHTINAVYNGDSSLAASAAASPLVETVNAVAHPGVDGPRVELVQRFGIHSQPTVLVVRFNVAGRPDVRRETEQLPDHRSGRSAGPHQVRGLRIANELGDAAAGSPHQPSPYVSPHRDRHGTQRSAQRTDGVLLDGTTSR